MQALNQERKEALEHFGQLANSWTHLLFDCLEEIIKFDKVLNEAQPIHSGRIRVMWFKSPSSDQSFPGERTPMMVQWTRNFHTGKWRALRVPLSRLLKYQHQSKSFAQNRKRVRFLLSSLRTLLLMRQVIKKSLVIQPNISRHWVPLAQNNLTQLHQNLTHQEICDE
jgi:hypothetical protein